MMVRYSKGIVTAISFRFVERDKENDKDIFIIAFS